MLKHRLTFGPILIALIFALSWLDQWIDAQSAPGFFPEETYPPGVVVAPFLALIGALGARELARILRAKSIQIHTFIAAFVAVVGVLVVGLTPWGSMGSTVSTGSLSFAIGLTSVAGVFVIGLLYAIRAKQVDGAIFIGAGTLMIHVYMGLMLGFLLLIRREHSVWLLIWVLACVKSCDIGAFFTGTTIGRTKLIPWLSPKKTWEGLVGGVVTSGAVGALGLWILGQSGYEAFNPLWGAGLGVLFGLVGQAGDLTASLFKRDAGIKDAGTSVPGFGGVLDLVDSPILVAPFAYWAIVIMTELSVTVPA
ncbi:MAG: phosphatidate cytidylyltransferase [Phycisphaerales bacterium]